MDFLLLKACPQCGRVAVEDNDDLTNEKFVYCDCCGYNLIRELKLDVKEGKRYVDEKEYKGYGVLVLTRRDGRLTETLLNSPLSDKEIEKYKNLFPSKKIKRKKSYLVLYNDGKFVILFGQPPERFHLSFEEFKEKYDYNPFKEFGVYED
ncbi:hypothetical protein [Neobacillus mesonae]|uniref:Uncharacterized protein n=1 Tax=Neobacillus mesonae TaxID=1193713 RepID=A0A3Q9QSZ5_9BACI|nr:hypothetical protein [Neobacillus mesonae]AZU62579.1 hypothetical protein CHR53_15615 [Neobacillus mesonae]